MRFYALKFNMARPIFTPPEVPAERIAALQAAFEATMKDEQYLADAKKIGLDTNWLGARELTAQVRQIEETPQAVVDRLRELLAKARNRSDAWQTDRRGTVGIVRPTQRTGGFEELLRILPKGIKLVPLALDVRRGALDEFQAAIPAYESKVAELARWAST